MFYDDNNSKREVYKLAGKLFNNHKWIRHTIEQVPNDGELIILDIKFSNIIIAKYYINKYYFKHPSLKYVLHKRQLNSNRYNYNLYINDFKDSSQVIVTINKKPEIIYNKTYFTISDSDTCANSRLSSSS